MGLIVAHNPRLHAPKSETIFCGTITQDLHTIITERNTSIILAIASHLSMASIVYIMPPSQPSILHHPNNQASEPSQFFTNNHIRIRTTLALSCLSQSQCIIQPSPLSPS